MNYPVRRSFTILRKRADDKYEQRVEVWDQLAEFCDGYTPKKLISSVSTGRVFERVGRAPADTKPVIPALVVVLFEPSTFDQILFKLVEGDSLDMHVGGFSEVCIGNVNTEEK